MKPVVRAVAGTLAAVAVARAASWTAAAARGLPTAVGASDRALREAATGSPEYADGTFRNPEPTTMFGNGESLRFAREAISARGRGRPVGAVPLQRPEVPDTAGELAVTWYGHASALVEVDGHRILADPVWGERVSPSPTIGPKRLHAVPGPLEDLPHLDAIVISHDHYDHLDLPTVRTLLRTQSAPFLVPMGVGAHLRRWSVPEHRIVELDWGSQAEVGELTIVCTRARHFSGRWLKRNDTLWSSWAIVGPRHRVYFGGDTGYTAAFADISAEHGPFDLTLLPIGAYGEQWPDIHMNPEEAVQAQLDLGGALLVPIHWATFNLAFHTWSEPADRLYAAAVRAGVRIYVPRPGERIDALDLDAVPPPTDWWTAVDHPGEPRESSSRLAQQSLPKLP